MDGYGWVAKGISLATRSIRVMATVTHNVLVHITKVVQSSVHAEPHAFAGVILATPISSSAAMVYVSGSVGLTS
jgi:hypothetical protein